MGKYLKYFQVCFVNILAYKADFTLSIAFNMIFFVIYFVLWKTIYMTSGTAEINSYSLSNTITYYFITAIIFRFNLDAAIYLGEEIWNGQLSNDLIKPWNVKAIHVFAALTDVGLTLLVSIPFFAIIYVFAHDYIVFPSLINLLFFLVTLILGFFLNLVFHFIFHSLTFFFGDQEANIKLINYLVVFLAGAFFPLTFLPAYAKGIFETLPFRYLYDVPANIFIGKMSTTDIFYGWGQMILWTIILYFIFQFLFKKGLTKYTGIGR